MDSAVLIAQRAISGLQLTSAERAQLTPGPLVQLAIGQYIELTREERDRNSPELLAQLAIGANPTLTRAERDRADPGEIQRFEPDLRIVIETSLRHG